MNFNVLIVKLLFLIIFFSIYTINNILLIISIRIFIFQVLTCQNINLSNLQNQQQSPLLSFLQKLTKTTSAIQKSTFIATYSP